MRARIPSVFSRPLGGPLIAAKFCEVRRPLIERSPLLIEVVVDVVGRFHAFACVVEYSLGDIDLDTQLREAGAPGTA